jgi:galactokinase
VNLIGEHIDYNGLPVFPMAIQRQIEMVFRPRSDSRIRVLNNDPEFPASTFTLSTRIAPDPAGSWSNYLKAGCQALAGHFTDLGGMDALVSSTLPVAAGLSSSSALVIATARSLLHANGREMPALELAEEMARAERYTGTQGGGMDQSISLTGKEGHATRIEFHPLRVFHTPLPTGWRFVIAHSMVRAEKSGPAQAAYNRRREECREALRRIWTRIEPGELLPPGVATPTPPDGSHQAGGLTYAALIEGVPLKELVGLADQVLQGALRKRFRHVVTEAVRVYEAERSMRRGDLPAFGVLMDASHESLRSDYEVSSPELDTLAELARTGGAAGARLTGAGFGGCIVALAQEDREADVIHALEHGYYRARGHDGALDNVLLTAEPSAGASVHPI